MIAHSLYPQSRIPFGDAAHAQQAPYGGRIGQLGRCPERPTVTTDVRRGGRTGRTRIRPVRVHYEMGTCWVSQSVMNVSTCGSMVVSIVGYSLGAPVSAGCMR